MAYAELGGAALMISTPLSVTEPRRTDGASQLSALVTSLFEGWRRRSVQFVVLRNYESLPQSMGNDLDVLVDDLRAAECVLLECARSAGYRLCHHVPFGSQSYYFTDPSTVRPIRIDLMTRVDWYGFLILRADDVFANSSDCRSFRIPHPAHEASLKLLLRLLYHGYVPEKYRASIRDAFASERAFAVRTLESSFGSRVARQLVQSAAAGAWEEIESRCVRLRAAIVLHNSINSPWTTLTLWLRDSARRIRRLLHPAGVSVALLGPDGSGKSAVARALLELIDLPLYRDKGLCIHWKPEILPRFRKGDPEESLTPHATPPRNRLASSFYFFVHLVEFVLGGAIRIRPVLYANGLVVLDRYYDDFYVDTARYRLRLPAGLAAIGSRFVPAPDMVVVLDAPPATLLSRKKEVAKSELERQREAFRRLADRLPNAYLVDASQPLEAVVDEVRQCVIQHLTMRTALRLCSGSPCAS